MRLLFRGHSTQPRIKSLVLIDLCAFTSLCPNVSHTWTSFIVTGDTCNILTCTKFHYLTHSNGNTCPIAVCLLQWVAQYMLNEKLYNPGAYAKQVFLLCTPLLCTEKWWRIRILHRDCIYKILTNAYKTTNNTICSTMAEDRMYMNELMPNTLNKAPNKKGPIR